MNARPHHATAPPTWRVRLRRIIFEADTPAGKAFDVGLIVTILASVLVVMLETVAEIEAHLGGLLYALEWGFTLLFTVEYVLRLATAERPVRYARSFFGLVDVLAVLPTYLSLLLPGAQQLLLIRALRVLRIFRVLKLSRYHQQASVLQRALVQSRFKIVVFLATVLSIAAIMGAVMHLLEGPARGFTSIPRGMYWAIVTMTTVGYGDISPQTVPGQLVASALMILGYGIIAVPTGIVSAELVRADASARGPASEARSCLACTRGGHDADAAYCKHCGALLSAPARPSRPPEGEAPGVR